MNVGTIKTLAGKRMGRSLLVLQKHTPTILTATGIVGVVATTVLASKATLKLEPIIDEMDESLAVAKNVRVEAPENYSERDYTKDLTRAYTTAVVKVGKLYAPAISLGVLSISCLISSHGIMQKRNVALAAAYKTVEEGFSAYRQRVIEKFGEEKDQEIRIQSMKTLEVEEKDPKTGKTTTTKVFDPNRVSDYARFFDESNPNWRRADDQLNFFFVKQAQTYMNNLLQARGHVFLNEAYDALGIPRTQAGAVVGWVISKDGDNFVDFGIYDSASEKARQFVNGQERSLLLDFNVDGVIYDKI